MKQYKKDVIKSLAYEEAEEALELLSPSTPVVLDYLINALENGINRNTDGRATLNIWNKTLSRVISARELYPR